MRALEAWAYQRTRDGRSLDPAAAVKDGLAPAPVMAAQVLARWVARQLRRRDVDVDASALVGAGVLDYVPAADRASSARWLLRLVERDRAVESAPEGAGARDPRPLGAGDFVSALETSRERMSRRIRTRPSRARERSDRVVAAAIPAGSRRAPDRTAFLEALRAAPTLAHRRADFVANLARFAEALAKMTNWEGDRCASPTWARLQQLSGKERASVHRYLTALHEAGLVGFVASGQAAHTIANQADADRNLAGVYVLCTPDGSAAVDVTETPPAEGLRKETRHASARDPQAQTVPLRGRALTAARSGPSRDNVPDASVRLTAPMPSPTSGQDQPAGSSSQVKRSFGPFSPDEHATRTKRNLLTQRFVELMEAGWQVADLQDGLEAPIDAQPPRAGTDGVDLSDRRWTRASRGAARLAVAHLLRRNCPPLRALSSADVAVLVEDFVLAGWSARDLHHALDHRPAGTAHFGGAPTSDGSPDRSSARVRGWLRWRLGQWRGPSGEPGRSHTQRAVADRNAADARNVARAARRESERVASGVGGARGRTAELIAEARAAAAAGNARWAQLHPGSAQ